MPSTSPRGRAFTLVDRSLDAATGIATFDYDLDGHPFQEEIRLPHADGPDDPATLDHLLDLCHVVIGTSYFKVSAPSRIVLRRTVASSLLELLSRTYDDGLREFAYVNELEIPLRFALDAAGTTDDPQAARSATHRQPLAPLGGGKDSAAVLSLLPHAVGLAISPSHAQRHLAAAAGVPLLEVGRTLDPRLADATRAGMNGHIPVTAINSAISALVAFRGGFDCVVMGNERSANEPTRIEAGVPINHQYSKSFEFEQLLHAAIAPSGVDYFSLLRPLSELAIASIVAADDRVRGSFLSCNRAFRRSLDPDEPQPWCLECPKCLFTYLVIAPFLDRSQAIEIFGGNPLADAARADGFRDLWLADTKPFDCVGERAESAVAMTWLAEMPGWADDVVVTTLHAEAAQVAAQLGATRDQVLQPSGPHLIPPEWRELVHAPAAASTSG